MSNFQPRTDAQRLLAQKHGTPLEYEDAVWAAYATMDIDMTEALAAITKYRVEWHDAGEQNDTTVAT